MVVTEDKHIRLTESPHFQPAPAPGSSSGYIDPGTIYDRCLLCVLRPLLLTAGTYGQARAALTPTTPRPDPTSCSVPSPSLAVVKVQGPHLRRRGNGRFSRISRQPVPPAVERFDFRKHFTSSKDANRVACVKNKYVGINREDLELPGVEGEDSKVYSPSVRTSPPSVI